MISPLPSLSLLPEKDDLAPDLQRAAQYIDAHLDDSLTIGEVATAAGVAGRTLHKHFHDEHGTSPMRYVRDCRFTQVRRALSGGLELGELGRVVGAGLAGRQHVAETARVVGPVGLDVRPRDRRSGQYKSDHAHDESTHPATPCSNLPGGRVPMRFCA